MTTGLGWRNLGLMAIQFARARYVSRSTGGDAVRSAAYNARAALTAERTGQVFYFKNRSAPDHHEILLPEGAAARFSDCGVLWNAAEAAERRRDSQVAREVLLALPADGGLTAEDRIALARSFALENFVSKGVAVQLDVHAPHEPAADGEEAGAPTNYHAHLLITTRRLEGERFAAKKARDLDPEMRACAPHLHGGAVKRGYVADAEAWGELWREHQDRYFREHGFSARVDVAAIHPGAHIGPVRMRKPGSDLAARAAVLRRANEAAARDPAQVLEALTRNSATFTARDVDRFLARHIDDGAERAAVKRAVLGHGDALALLDRETLISAGRWTTRPVRAQELAALTEGEALASAPHHGGPPAGAAAAALQSRTLRADQRAAFDHAIAAGALKIIEGRAGTGKSYTLQAVRAAHELAGFRVVGLGPTNAVAQDLKAEGFSEAETAHAALFKLKNGRGQPWDARTVVIVDEAAMMDSHITGEILAAARASGSKLILAGDDRQLASIERGGLFTELKERHGAAAIVAVTRQRDDWQRQASRDLAEGRFTDAVAAYDRHGAISWTETQDEARAALVEAWRRDAAGSSGAARFVFAYTNKDVDALNAELRGVRRAQGALSGVDVVFETRHGALPFAVGDRVQLTDTLKRAGLYNGNAGVITGVDRGEGRIWARLDAAAGQAGRDVTWTAAEFGGFRHGYAGTIYKGQGKTLDHAYLYHTHHWRSAASYVALTRQRESARIFVATETTRNARDLARQMARGEVKAASVAWTTAAEAAARAEAPLREARRRLARDPGAVRRHLENLRIEQALRPILPALAQAIERQTAAVTALTDAAARFAEKMQTFAGAALALRAADGADASAPIPSAEPEADKPEPPALRAARAAVAALRDPPSKGLPEVKRRELKAKAAIKAAPPEARKELYAEAREANLARINEAMGKKQREPAAAALHYRPTSELAAAVRAVNERIKRQEREEWRRRLEKTRLLFPDLRPRLLERKTREEAAREEMERRAASRVRFEKERKEAAAAKWESEAPARAAAEQKRAAAVEAALDALVAKAQDEWEQKIVAMQKAAAAQEAAWPGLARDFPAALPDDPAASRAPTELRAPERETDILAAMDRERQAQLDPTIKAERLAARWKDVEQDQDKLDPWQRYLEQKEEWAAVETRMNELTSEIGKDPQMDAVLWARRDEFGIGERRALGEALRNSAAIVALEGELEPRPSPSPGMSM
ncbi:AAA family ATPase [Methylocella tundrae]|uniref:AAA family ATPase n=1 Tax=Methylocella tundrae TaxID=227605 RepID=UPI00157AE8EE|nr:AAA family ATPase [Methylocella tundrae]